MRAVDRRRLTNRRDFILPNVYHSTYLLCSRWPFHLYRDPHSFARAVPWPSSLSMHTSTAYLDYVSCRAALGHRIDTQVLVVRKGGSEWTRGLPRCVEDHFELADMRQHVQPKADQIVTAARRASNTTALVVHWMSPGHDILDPIANRSAPVDFAQAPTLAAERMAARFGRYLAIH